MQAQVHGQLAYTVFSGGAIVQYCGDRSCGKTKIYIIVVRLDRKSKPEGCFVVLDSGRSVDLVRLEPHMSHRGEGLSTFLLFFARLCGVSSVPTQCVRVLLRRQFSTLTFYW